MDYPSLSNAKLGQLDDVAFYYGASCQDCLRRRRISLVRLRSMLGDDFLLGDVRARLKCSTCGSKNLIVSFWTPAHKGVMFAEYFTEVPT